MKGFAAASGTFSVWVLEAGHGKLESLAYAEQQQQLMSDRQQDTHSSCRLAISNKKEENIS